MDILKLLIPCISVIICVYLLVYKGIDVRITQTKTFERIFKREPVDPVLQKKLMEEIELQAKKASNDAVKKVNEFLNSGGIQNG